MPLNLWSQQLGAGPTSIGAATKALQTSKLMGLGSSAALTRMGVTREMMGLSSVSAAAKALQASSGLGSSAALMKMGIALPRLPAGTPTFSSRPSFFSPYQAFVLWLE